jgi:hypothetical protein
MKTSFHKQEIENIVISLIKDDILNCKLTTSLNELGLNADEYLLNISESIFILLGFENRINEESTFEMYIELLKQFPKTNPIVSYQAIHEQAIFIYHELRKKFDLLEAK